MTVGTLVTIFPKFLVNPLSDIFHLPKQSVSIVFVLFFFSLAKDNIIFFDKMLKPRKKIVSLEVNTGFSVLIANPSSLNNLMVSVILSSQTWYVSLRRYESSKYIIEL